jgi:hypothetical protein
MSTITINKIDYQINLNFTHSNNTTANVSIVCDKPNKYTLTSEDQPLQVCRIKTLLTGLNQTMYEIIFSPGQKNICVIEKKSDSDLLTAIEKKESAEKEIIRATSLVDTKFDFMSEGDGIPGAMLMAAGVIAPIALYCLSYDFFGKFFRYPSIPSVSIVASTICLVVYKIIKWTNASTKQFEDNKNNLVIKAKSDLDEANYNFYNHIFSMATLANKTYPSDKGVEFDASHLILKKVDAK